LNVLLSSGDAEREIGLERRTMMGFGVNLSLSFVFDEDTAGGGDDNESIQSVHGG